MVFEEIYDEDDVREDDWPAEDAREGGLRRRAWSPAEYLEKVEQELAAGRFASQSK